ncbi:Transposase, Helix-turn-helix domain [Propionibacterium ruminifibrarum]|uniref:Transposase, Helix-turn-helix domain n=1 Tax=Propionibacterium ruminifibrarum TaxID=1962131 RepID=A0A375I5K1_9ACTN|nr:Transposase, Helix-turn-helix domain [Propionibacterium ruminifibrarum]
MKRNNQGTGRRPHAITRLTHTQIQDLCQKIHATVNGALPAAGSRRLGPYQSIRLVLASLRHNLEQESLSELFGISQPTVSRVLTAWTPLIAGILEQNVPTADGLDPDTQLIIDGTLIPCWAWRDKPELYSGKHHTTGANLQVACTLTGHLAWVSDPLPGRTHDARALTESGLLHPNSELTSNDPPRCPLIRHIADKRYAGTGLITPVKKPAGLPKPETHKNYNRAINKIRWQIEQVMPISKPGTLSKPATDASRHHHCNTRNHIHLHPK